MRPQSLVIPFVLIFIGAFSALVCASNEDFLLAAVWALVAAVGWNEMRQTNDFNKNFDSE